MGKSRESVIKQRDERISFNKIYAKWAGTRPDPNYDNPSEPLCDVCEHNSGNRRWSPQEREAWEIVHKIYEEWARKAERAIQTLIKTDGRLAKSANNPFRHVGGVLRDYTRALKEAQQKLLTLQNQLTLTEQTAKGIIGNIDSMSNEVSDSISQVNRTYSELPQNVRDILENNVGDESAETSPLTPPPAKEGPALIDWYRQNQDKIVWGNSFTFDVDTEPSDDELIPGVHLVIESTSGDNKRAFIVNRGTGGVLVCLNRISLCALPSNYLEPGERTAYLELEASIATTSGGETTIDFRRGEAAHGARAASIITSAKSAANKPSTGLESQGGQFEVSQQNDNARQQTAVANKNSLEDENNQSQKANEAEQGLEQQERNQKEVTAVEKAQEPTSNQAIGVVRQRRVGADRLKQQEQAPAAQNNKSVDNMPGLIINKPGPTLRETPEAQEKERNQIAGVVREHRIGTDQQQQVQEQTKLRERQQTPGGIVVAQDQTLSAQKTKAVITSDDSHSSNNSVSRLRATPTAFVAKTAESAFKYYNSDKWGKAEELFRTLTEEDPENANWYHFLGSCLLNRGKLEDAEASLRRAVQLNPKKTDTYSLLGFLLSDTHRKKDAEAAFKKAIQLEPTEAQWYNNFGIFLFEEKRWKEAEAAYAKAVELDPITPKYRDNLKKAQKHSK